MDKESLTGFEDYIVRNQLVPAKYARYHRVWVERWLAFAGGAVGADADTARRRFLEQLTHDGRTAGWQVRQADDAVKLYLWNYLPTVRSAQTPPAAPRPPAAAPSGSTPRTGRSPTGSSRTPATCRAPRASAA